MDSICQTEVSAERVAEFVDSISGEKATNRMVDHSVPVIKGENLAYASQNELFFSDSIKNNVALSESVDDRKLKQTFEKTSVDFLSGEHSPETQLDKKGQPLSGGQQKRINLARAFYNDSDVLILDEPTASLDKETKAKVLEAIKCEKEKRSVILITHDRETYEICDRML
jgi:ABC-type transport system involved in cytochrome bd biosynthesis fused ATPase/permease subunit